MASILFDDITFPRELYDPDTLEFVAPVSTLLAFTPHILSQLAKTSEDAQEPLPAEWQASGASAATSSSSSTAAPNNPKVKTEGDPSSSSSSTAEPGTGTASKGGIFSSFANLANHQTLGNGLFLAGRFMDGKTASASSARTYEREREWERERERNSRAGNNYWFGSTNYSHPQQERARMREMEDRLRTMERELDQNKAMARSEVEQQRRDRFNLEQELENQRAKVQKLEQEVEKEQKKREKEKKDQDEKEKQRKKQEEKEKGKEKQKSEVASTKESKEGDEDSNSSKAVVREDDAVKAAKAVLVATVGVASLVMAFYSAHKASSTYSVITFHSQLEQLMSQCDGVVQSTEAWISEQFLEVPDQIRQDLKLIKELMETIHRLDPRSEKKVKEAREDAGAVYRSQKGILMYSCCLEKKTHLGRNCCLVHVSSWIFGCCWRCGCRKYDGHGQWRNPGGGLCPVRNHV